ncbi:MAG TPA: SDR family NAD(P)-dependent oxidoreductase [Polyangiaceae bacterium]|nr:SDR family NAD(P)-dependent oxidoreductase [Polyangiaceae bacterium]
MAPTACATPMYSTITGARVAAALDAAYWVQNVRSQVKFHGATSAMLRDGINVLFEIGPHPDLRRHLLDTVSRCAPSPVVASSLRRNAGERDSLLRGVGALYTAGQDVDFDAINGEGRLVAAPRYPWQRQRHWMDPASVAISVDVSPRPEEKSRPAHPLLGVRLVGERAATFESVLGDGQPALLEDHRLHGAVVVPAVAYIEAILAASSELGGGGECELRDVAIQEALVVPDRERRAMRTVIEEAGDGFSFRISSLDSDRVSERTHVSGTLVIRGLNGAAGSATDLDLAALTGRCASEVPVDAYYQELRRRGFDYGPAFRGIRRCWVGAEDAFGLVDLGEGSSQDRDGYRLHPTLLEGCLQVAGVLAPSRIDMNDTYVPIGIERVRFFGGAGDSLWSHARLRPDHPDNRETLVADVRIFSAMGVLVAEVRGLAAKRAGARSFIKAADARIHGWLHAVEWRLAEARPPTGERAPWLVLADVGSWAPLLREHVESQGRRCVLVSRSEAASFEDGDREESEREEAFVAALSSELAKEEGRVDVICLWPLDQSPLRGEPVDLGAVLGRSVTSLLALARALERVGKANAKLWVVTTNAHRVRERDVPDPAQAALWGLAATLGLEYASHWGGIVDVAGEASPASARALAEAIDRGREDRAAVRADSVWVPRLRRLRGTDSAEPLPVVEDATYLVTGGLGGIGLEAARWLCNRGARQLVLLGRREPSEDARAAVDEMERKGTRVATLPIDVSDAAALSEVLERVKREGPPLRGVFHAAGVLDDGTLARQTWRRFAGVLAGKAQGAWNLDVLTRGEELDFFVCFSSLASAFGSPGQGSYATANAFLDGLAQLRASEGRPAMTANWGPWSEVGMAARLGADAHWRRVPGLSPLATHDGLKALERALAQRVPQVLVLPVNWTDFARALSDPPPWMADVTPSIPDGPASPRFSVDAAFLDGLRASPAHERPDAISRFLRRQIAEVVGAKPEDIDPDRGLFDLGFDSLMAMELKNRLQGMLGRTLPATALFEHPDLSALSRYLADELGRAVDAPPRSPTPASAPSRLSISSDILARVEEMSDEEVERTLAEMAPEGEA